MTGDRTDTRAAPARRFAAIAIPEEQRHALDRALGPARTTHPQLRWSRPDGWHLTLAFLGTLENERVAEATDALRAAADTVDAPRSLTLGRAGRFDRRVLWLGLEDDPPGALSTLATAVRDALVERSFLVDHKPLRAHLTLARAGRSTPITDAAVADADVMVDGAMVDGAMVADEQGPTAARWSPDSVQLWRSVPGGGPARYEVDAVIALSAPGTG